MLPNFPIKKTRGLSPLVQIALIVVLFLATVGFCYIEFIHGEKAFGRYPFVITVFLAAIYEELFFRGILFSYLKKHYSVILAIVYSSIVFGLRHAKNIFYDPNPWYILYQMAYTGLIFWPIMAYIYHKTDNIWICIILHFLHNLCILLLLLYGG